MGIRKAVISAGAAFALAMAFTLVGCGSGQHEVIDQGQECSSAIWARNSLRRRRTFVSRSIKRNRIRQNLCRAGSGLQTHLRFPGRLVPVPEQVSSAKVADGSARLQPSLKARWAICGTGKSVKAQLVTVSSEASGPADVGIVVLWRWGNGRQLVESVSMQTSWSHAERHRSQRGSSCCGASACNRRNNKASRKQEGT